jgi:hypothetical protein
MKKKILKIKSPLNLDKYLAIAKINQYKAHQYFHKDGELIKGYKYLHWAEPELRDFVHDLGLENFQWSWRFVYIAPNTELPIHSDKGTRCAINFVLTGKYPIQWVIDENARELNMYETAILDVTQPHFVQTGWNERILLKLSFLDAGFEEVCEAWYNFQSLLSTRLMSTL